MQTDNSDTPYRFASEQVATSGVHESSTQKSWKLLIVDDDQEVHVISRIVLRDLEFEGRALELISAYSGEEAKDLIQKHKDIAVILLDVVMETENAGLNVVRFIRETLQNKFIRIILRTGQPGDAPEKDIVINYDINNYKEKTELSSEKLTTAIISGIRAYRDIMSIENSRLGLEKVIDASRHLFEPKSLVQFCTGVLHQLATLLSFGCDAMYANTSSFTATRTVHGDFQRFTILAGTGVYSNAVGKKLTDLSDPALAAIIENAASSREPTMANGTFTAFFQTQGGIENIVFANTKRDLSDLDKKLLMLFAMNIGVAFDNLHTHQEIADTQKDIIDTLGEVIGSRASGTDNRIRRISRLTIELGKLFELPAEDLALLQIAAPLHDLGTISIPQSILEKEGPLTPGEEQEMRRHTLTGHHLLRSSKRPALRSAALAALQHHEWWDGSGYPNGISGADIHIFARIIAMAEALANFTAPSQYDEKELRKSLFDFVTVRRGNHFDPHLVDMLIAKQEPLFHILNTVTRAPNPLFHEGNP